MTNHMESIVSMQARENRKLLDVAVSRGCANNSPAKINFIFAATADGIKENRTILLGEGYTRSSASKKVIYKIIHYSGCDS